MKNKVHRPSIKKNILNHANIKNLIYKSIFVLVLLLVLVLIKKLNFSSTRNVIQVIKSNINYEFNLVEDGKKVYKKAQIFLDDSLESIGVFSGSKPKYIAPISGTLFKTFDQKVLIDNVEVKNGGIDINSNQEQEPISIIKGTVTRVEKKDKKGYFITIKNDELDIVYGYLSKVNANEGDTLEVGDQIGILGKNKDGKKYLRVEIYIDGVAVDPMDYIKLSDGLQF